jgi:predicted protein tyrosine phosphatase
MSGTDATGTPRKLLFICSRNRIRSLTVEHLLARNPAFQVRSAGTSPQACIRVNAGHLGWADLIFVMEKCHQQMLRAQFPDALNGKSVICLDIPDEFAYMDDDLVDIIWSRLSAHIDIPD